MPNNPTKEVKSYVNPTAVEVITSMPARLKRPENIAFSLLGDLKAVANSDDRSVSIYPRAGATGPVYETTPCCVLKNHVHLDYVHGVDFSPDGCFLATVARQSHTLAVYRRRNDKSGVFNPNPIWTMSGVKYGLCYPSDVSYHPSGRNLVIANRIGGISFYNRIPGNKGLFGFNASRTISREMLLMHGLDAPHGLTYMPDGRRLLICHAKFGINHDKRGRSGISAFDWNEESNHLVAGKPALVHFINAHLHSVAAHPSGRDLGLTICERGSILFRYIDDPCRIELLEHIVHQSMRSRGSPKGIGFTRDGARLEITNDDDEIQVYELTR